MRVNPVLRDLCRALALPLAGPAQRVYFGCLVFQGLALILWWPKHALEQALTIGQGPQPLLAVMTAIGISIAYYCIRHGAEEFLLDGQQSLREWAVATDLPCTRLIAGSIMANLIHVALLMLLSAPLVAMAFGVGSGYWPNVAASAATIFVQALAFWLAGAVVYFAIGQHAQMALISIRFMLAAVYVGTALWLPSLSHLMVSIELLGTGGFRIQPLAGWPAWQQFLLVHAALAVILSAVLWRLLRRVRAASRASVGEPAGG